MLCSQKPPCSLSFPPLKFYSVWSVTLLWYVHHLVFGRVFAIILYFPDNYMPRVEVAKKGERRKQKRKKVKRVKGQARENGSV